MVDTNDQSGSPGVIALIVPLGAGTESPAPEQVAGRRPAEWPAQALRNVPGIKQVFCLHQAGAGESSPLDPSLAQPLQVEHLPLSSNQGSQPSLADIYAWLGKIRPQIPLEDAGQKADVLVVAQGATLLSSGELARLVEMAGQTNTSALFMAVEYRNALRPQSNQPEPCLGDPGVVYYFKGASLELPVSLVLEEADPYIVPAQAIWQPQGREQWLAAEAILRDRQRGQRLELLPEKPGAIVFDFDGVFTDNRVLVWEDGREGVLCNRGDGMGFDLLRERGFPVLVLSKERNPVVAARCKKLKLPCHQGEDDKITKLNQWLGEQGVPLERAIYVGNDVNDLECLEAVGCGVAPADAHSTAANVSQIILEANGGFGAVREIIDLLLHRLGA